MKITKKDMKLLIYVAGILLIIASYFLGYKNFAEKKETLEAENAKLSQQAARIQDIYNKQEEYKQQTEDMKADAEQILSEYPAEVREEDSILYGKDLEEQFDATISNITIAKANQLYSMAANAVAEDGTQTDDTAETTTDETAGSAETAGTTETDTDKELGIISQSEVELPEFSLYDTAVTYEFKINYDDCKSLFGSILSYADKRNVPSIALAYDEESGQLLGNMLVNMYYIIGTEKTYSEPNAGAVPRGTDNIFGTLKKQEKQSEEDSQE